MPEAIDVGVVEDHPIFRRGLRAILTEAGQPTIRLVGEAVTVAAARALVAEHVPDVLVVDLMLGNDPDAGITVIRETRVLSPHTQVLVITALDGADHLLPALQAGANGCISKADQLSGDEIRHAIAVIAAGEPYYGPLIFRRLHDLVQSGVASDTVGGDLLTPREREVLQLIAAECSNQQIADRLVISVKTVKTHVSNILSKLQLQSRYEAAMVYRMQQAQTG